MNSKCSIFKTIKVHVIFIIYNNYQLNCSSIQMSVGMREEIKFYTVFVIFSPQDLG